jgi:hypothetical protein
VDEGPIPDIALAKSTPVSGRHDADFAVEAGFSDIPYKQ